MDDARSPERSPERSPAEPSNDADLAPRPADAVVVDLGNVLIHWDPVAAIATAVGTGRAVAFVADQG